jgi:hypothetical protein
VYDDWEGVSGIECLPDDAPHMKVDRAILESAAKNSHVRTAIVCPPLINRVSNNKNGAREQSAARQYVVDILKRKKGFYINKGKSC